YGHDGAPGTWRGRTSRYDDTVTYHPGPCPTSRGTTGRRERRGLSRPVRAFARGTLAPGQGWSHCVGHRAWSNKLCSLDLLRESVAHALYEHTRSLTNSVWLYEVYASLPHYAWPGRSTQHCGVDLVPNAEELSGIDAVISIKR